MSSLDKITFVGAWQWFALKVAPNREFAAERILRAEGFDVFVPVRHIRSKQLLIAKARLPGYVFIGFNTLAIPWRDILRFRMIIGFVTFNGAPMALPNMDIFRTCIGSERPIRVISLRNIRRRQRSKQLARAMKISSGPYEGRQVQACPVENEIVLYEMFKPYLAEQGKL